MCGIAGFIGRGESTDLARMIDALAHRGPDGTGTWIAQPVFFGHRRLSIVDLASGSQPMTTLDGQLVITFNGEIYNHADLRTQLEQLGHRFKNGPFRYRSSLVRISGMERKLARQVKRHVVIRDL
jgi:asparagine synthase (glutamine-hydrolysing)